MSRVKPKLPKWLKKLTAADRKHLKEMEITSLRGMKICAERQKRMRDASTEKYGHVPGIHEPCYDCKRIAEKLGLPV